MAFQEKVALALALDYIDKRSSGLAEAWNDITEAELNNELQSDFMEKEMVAIYDFVNQALVSSRPVSGCGAYLNSHGITLSFIRSELIKHTLRHIRNKENQKTKNKRRRR